MGASGGARLVGPVGAVAEIIIQAGERELDRGVGDAGEMARGFVVFGDCRLGQRSEHRRCEARCPRVRHESSTNSLDRHPEGGGRPWLHGLHEWS